MAGAFRMNKADLTISLLRYRMERAGMLQGYSKGEAALMAEQRLKNEGMLGFFGKMKAAGTPEGTVVVMVETFWRSMGQQISANPAVARAPATDPAKQVMTKQFGKNAIDQIEGHRSRFYGGTEDYPASLSDYVVYRIGTEVRQMHYMEPEQMGLDREAISHMVEE